MTKSVHLSHTAGRTPLEIVAYNGGIGAENQLSWQQNDGRLLLEDRCRVARLLLCVLLAQFLWTPSLHGEGICTEICSPDSLLLSGSFETELQRSRDLLKQIRNRAAASLAQELSCRTRTSEAQPRRDPGRHPFLDRCLTRTAEARPHDVGQALNVLVESCYHLGRREPATLCLATEAIELLSKAPVPDPDHLAQALLNRGRLFIDGTSPDFEQAFQDLERAYDITEAKHGELSPKLSQLLNAFSELFGESISAAEKASRLAWFPPSPDSISETLEFFERALLENNLPRAGLSEVLDSPASAAALWSIQLLRHRDRAKKIKGADLAEAYNAATNVFERQQRFAEALVAAQEALRIRSTVSKKGGAQIARSHHNLGWLFFSLGKVGKAATELQTAFELRSERVSSLRAEGKCGEAQAAIPNDEVACTARDSEEELDECERLIASDRLALGRLALSTGEVGRAIDHLGTAYRSLRRTYGRGSRIATVLADLSSAYEVTGQFEEAACYLSKAKKAAGDDQQGWQTRLLIAGGRLDVIRGRTRSGTEKLEQALSEISGYPEDRAVAQRALARAYLSKGELDQARRLLEESAAALTSNYERHSELLATYLDLASAELDQRFHTKALATLRVARNEMNLLGGEAFGGSARYELLMARVLAQRGGLSEALAHAVRSMQAWQKDIGPVLRVLPEAAALRFTRVQRESIALLLSLLSKQTGQQGVAEAWSALATSRGQILDEVRDRMRFAALSESPELNDLHAKSATYARLIVQELRYESGAVRRGAVSEARERLESARREYAEATAQKRGRPLRMQIEAEEFSRALPPGTALVSFFRSEGHPDVSGLSPIYSAFVVTGTKPVAAVNLGSADRIDDLVRRWRETLMAYIAGADPGMTKLQGIGAELGRFLWRPLVPYLAANRQVFLCGDGALLLFNFAALPRTGGGFLVEDGYQFHNLVSEKELLEMASHEPTFSGRILAMSPDFSRSFSGQELEDMDRREEVAGSVLSVWVQEAVASVGRLLDKLRFRQMADPCLGLPARPFLPLPGAHLELAAISDLVDELNTASAKAPGGEARALSFVSVTGAAATEATFKSEAPGFEYLHLATHGFFQRGCGVRKSDPGSVYSLSDRYSAGLAFSGANQKAPAMGQHGEDGILLDQEVSTMDLRAADWVVLSACETGLGAIADGEGLLGLARSFRVAGAKTLILSLWSVDDNSTRLWMSDLYRHRLLERRSTITAMSQAYLDRIKALRNANRDPHPVLWAGFVSTGAWQ